MFYMKKRNVLIKGIISIALVEQLCVFSTINATNINNVVTVYPSVETTTSHHQGDTADDTCIWIHPENKKLSLVIGDDKDGGIISWNLDGSEHQYTTKSKNMNNLDIRYNFKLGNQIVALVGIVNETDQSINFYKVNPVTRLIESVGEIKLDYKKPYGGCMYHSSLTDKYYFFVNWKTGLVQQWELNGKSGMVTGKKVRELKVSSQVEGCTADDDLRKFYLGEEEVGLWKFDAETDASTKGILVDSTDASKGGHLTADIEGITLYQCKDKDKGYVICSSQGNNTFQIYERKTNKYVGLFHIGSKGLIDEVTETDGCDVTNVDLGGVFKKGLFVAHDHTNDETDYSNHKYVAWEEIANKLNLYIDDSFNPTEGDNKKPKINDIKDKNVKVGQEIILKIKAVDEDGHKLDYYALNLPKGAQFNTYTHEFKWIPTKDQVGKHKIKFIVSDGYLLDNEKVTIKVKN